jgi:hypothetical protein
MQLAQAVAGILLRRGENSKGARALGVGLCNEVGFTMVSLATRSRGHIVRRPASSLRMMAANGPLCPAAIFGACRCRSGSPFEQL